MADVLPRRGCWGPNRWSRSRRWRCWSCSESWAQSQGRCCTWRTLDTKQQHSTARQSATDSLHTIQRHRSAHTTTTRMALSGACTSPRLNRPPFNAGSSNVSKSETKYVQVPRELDPLQNGTGSSLTPCYIFPPSFMKNGPEHNSANKQTNKPTNHQTNGQG